MVSISTQRDRWLYRDVENATRRIVLRARCIDQTRDLWSCDVYVLTHEPDLPDDGGACEEMHHQHLMDTFQGPDDAHGRGLEAGLDWIAGNR